jgi:hypothetical protein
LLTRIAVYAYCSSNAAITPFGRDKEEGVLFRHLATGNSEAELDDGAFDMVSDIPKQKSNIFTYVTRFINLASK